MTPEQYAVSQAAITAGLAAYIQRLASLFTGPMLSPREWLDFLRIIFPEVQKRYAQSAALGRNFYDSERRLYHPELERHDMLLTDLRFDWFVQNMEPARKALSQADAPRTSVAKVTLTAVREVEMAGRRQIIGAVKNDEAVAEEVVAAAEDNEERPRILNYKGEPVRYESENKLVQGWARVATGRETCAWCLMLISRGAKLNHKGNFAYAEAATAGINLDDETVIDLWEESGGNLAKFREYTEEYMEEWHTGCDCLVVPVFDINNWPGRDQALRALQLWIDAGREADRLIESGKSRTTNVNTETLNALRRRLERGDISMSNYAVAA